MKLPKYGIGAAVALALMYILYIIYCLVTGNDLNNGEIGMGITFVVCVAAILAFDYKHKNDEDNNDDE